MAGFCLTPIVVQEGSFGGPIIYENKQFVSPNQVRSDLRKRKAVRSVARAEQGRDRTARLDELGLRTKTRKPAVGSGDVRDLFA
jgi:ribosome biogenesis protein BRX1